MNIFARRPAALAAALGLLTVFVSFYVNGLCRAIMFAAAAILTLIGALSFNRIKYKTIAGMNAGYFVIIAGIMILIPLFSSISLWELEVGRFEELGNTDELVPVEAVVICKRSAADWYSNYDIELRSVAGDRMSSEGRLICKSDQALSIGDHIEFEALFSTLDEAYADYGLDKYDLIASGVRFVCGSDGEISRLGSSVSLNAWLSKLRAKISAAITIFTDRDTALMIKALLLSDKDGLGIFRRDMRRCGTSHLLALSGLHLAVVAAMLEHIGKRLKLSKLCRIILQLICALFMLAIAGFPYSLVRASVMLMIATVSRGIGGDRDMITVLLWTAWFIIIFDPAAIVDIGFQLSFFATFGVITATRANKRIKDRFHRFRRKHKKLRVLLKPLYGIVISLSAQLFILPLLYLNFGELSLISVAATMLLSPFVTLIVWLALPYTAAACLGLSLTSGILGALIGIASNAMRQLASALSSLPMYVSMRYDFSLWLMLLLPAALLVIGKFRKVDFLLAVMLFVLWNPLCYCAVQICELTRRYDNELSFVTLNTSDAALLRSDGKCMVVDISSGGVGLIRSIDLKLSEMELTEIDTYFLTHLHSTHIKSFRRLCENRLVRRLMLPEPTNEDEAAYARELIKLSNELGVEVGSYSRYNNEDIDFGYASITVEQPGKLSRSKHEIIGISFDLGNGSVFYAGSSRWELDEDVTAFDAVVIGTHGPKIKSEPEYNAKRILKVGESFKICGKSVNP